MAIKRKTRMYEPWGYQDQNNYQGSEIIKENDLDSFFAGVEYKRDDNKIHFTNKDGDEVGSLNVNDFVKSDSIIEKTEYKDGILKIYFTNGDIVTIDLTELLDENEFKDGLVVDENTVKVLVDVESEKWLTVSPNGVKVSGIQAEIDRLDGKVDDEIARATSEETRIESKLESKLDQEIADRIADVNEEETRAAGEETRIDTKLDQEITRSKDYDNSLDTRIGILNDGLTSEKTAREAYDVTLENRISSEISRATSAETELQGSIEEEGRRAQDAETALDVKIGEESARAISAETILAEGIETLGGDKFDDVKYDSSAKTIYFYAEGNMVASIDATDFIKDSMIDRVYIDEATKELVIVWNAESGKEETRIPLSDIFNPDNYYTKGEIDGKETALQAGINANAEAIASEESRALSAETDLQAAIELKADKETVYTQEEVDALIKAKETEIYNLTKLVGEIGGNVTYDYPNDLGTSLTSLLNNSGTVKLGEDATITRFGPGVTAKNKVKLNLNSHNLTATAAGSYGAIMGRGTQEITIGGKGTVEAGDGICIEANGAGCTINLTGSTSVYQNDRSGGELIYCYAGTINITNGTFKNNGEDKKYLLNCYDANYAAGTAKIIVSGGKFYDFNPADNSAEGEHTNFLAPGYHVETSTDGDSTVYTVKKDS